jgi:hypothetical protein
MGKKPVLIDDIHIGKKPVVNNAPRNVMWIFSFKEFKQIDNFGFQKTDSSWFSSLFLRLSEISKFEKESLHKNNALKTHLRYHIINWDLQNVPIFRKNLTWVNIDVINNEEEYPFYQFQISKALGRVIGYWDENIFNVVLLDPMHNLQPSSYSDYKIRQSSPVDSDLTSLLYKVDQIKQQSCNDCDCKIRKAIMEIKLTKKESNAVVCFLDNDFLEELHNLSHKHSISNILESGLLNLSN